MSKRPTSPDPSQELDHAERLANVVIRGLAGGLAVEIDGLGTFHPDAHHGFRFEPRRQRHVFLAYVTEDAVEAGRLCDALEATGFSVWMDVRKLLPGQNWPRAIEHAIETSDFFVACFSAASVGKRGGFQTEVRYALDCARRMPLDEIFVAPVRLDECRLPRAIQRELQYVDLFPDWQRGLRKLVEMLRRGRGWRSWEE
jgi:TIR domain